MESSMKLFDMFETYDGTSDAAVWIQRTKVIAEMQNQKLELLFPILLRKAAYSVYDALTVEDKQDAMEVEQVLLAAFSVDAYTAYELFTKRKLHDGERADVYLADLKRLAYLAKLSEEAVRLAFVVGLPEFLSSRFRAAKDPINIILPKVRAVLNSVKMDDSTSVGAVSQHQATKNLTAKVTTHCYNCQGLHHIAKNCLFAKNLPPKKIFQCFKCGAEGHMASRCLKMQGNERRSEGSAQPRF
jgi:hypothetical protein